jgi:hypothetical protein
VPRLPSLHLAVRTARDTLARFPLAMGSAFLAAGTAMWMIDGPREPSQPRLLFTALIGLPLFTATVTSAERRGVAPRHRGMAELVLAGALVMLYLTSLGWSSDLATLRFLQLLAAAHLLVAVGPYLGSSRTGGFWQFNRILFLRYLVGVFYTVVLFAGLALALGALDQLFGVDIDGETYGYLFALLSFGFHPWFFLSGVPRDYGALETLDDYPAGLKVFTQFVLMPLVVIYLAILTAYLGKVIVTRIWPNGWIGYLVSGVSAIGVLALLLVHPLRERADSRWVDGYGRWWFVALLPSLGMLLAAVAQRIGQYGVTEPRYFLLVLALWLGGLAIYYGLTASRNIRLIPVTLCALALVTATGPWSAYAVARRSQRGRLDRILERNQMGRAGAPLPARGTVPLEDRRELSAVLQYLAGTHGAGAVGEVLGIPEATVQSWAASSEVGAGSDEVAGRAMSRLGVRYLSRYEQGIGADQVWAHRSTPSSIPVTGYELLKPTHFPSTTWIGTPTDSLEVRGGDSLGVLTVSRGGAMLFSLDVAGALSARLAEDSTGAGQGIELRDPVSVDGEGGGFRVRLLLESFTGTMTNGRFSWQSGTGMLLASGFRPGRGPPAASRR